MMLASSNCCVDNPDLRHPESRQAQLIHRINGVCESSVCNMAAAQYPLTKGHRSPGTAGWRERQLISVKPRRPTARCHLVLDACSLVLPWLFTGEEFRGFGDGLFHRFWFPPEFALGLAVVQG
jgi:hypothetical protein